VNDYQLVSSTVLVTLWKDGKQVEWNRLDAVWDHVGDEPVFRAYLAQGLRELLDRS
jgi:Golgi nucleoside diphosphatase